MKSQAILDSGVLIGLFHQEDQFRKKSLSIFKAFEEGNLHSLYTTDYVLVECVNFLLKRNSYQSADALVRFLLETDRISVIWMSSESKQKLVKLFEKHKGLSLTDCSLVLLSQELDMDMILSFDSGFDRIQGLHRLEECND